jgi:hypothetical protein
LFCFFFPFCLHSSRRLLEKAMSASSLWQLRIESGATQFARSSCRLLQRAKNASSLWQLRSESGATQLHDPVAGFSRGRSRTLLLSDSWGVNPGPRNCTIW